MKTARRKLGDKGEAVAAKYLMAKGLKLVDHNVHAPGGELDLIMMDGDLWVFVEVKTRTSRAFGLPIESVYKRKIERMLSAIEHYFVKRLDWEMIPEFRIDVVAVEVRGEKFFCEHFESVGIDV